MQSSSLIKGISVGMTVGAMTYALSSAGKRQKKKIKSSTGKAIHAIGDIVDGISMMMR